MLFSSVSNLWRHSRNLFPDAGLSLLGVCTKEFTSAHFLLPRTFPRSALSLFRPLTELFTPAWDCSVDTEVICWVNRAKQVFCDRSIRIEVYGIAVIHSFQTSTTRSTFLFDLFQLVQQRNVECQDFENQHNGHCHRSPCADELHSHVHRIFSILKHVHPSERVATSAQVLREVTWVTCLLCSKVLPLFSCKPLYRCKSLVVCPKE